MKQKIYWAIMLLLCFSWLPPPTMAVSPAATLTVDGALYGSYPSVQAAADAVTQTAGSDFVLEIAGGLVTDPLNITQQPNKNLTIQPQLRAAVTFTNTITIDGNGNFSSPESLVIQNLSFDMTSGAVNNCIYFNLIPPRTGYCYPHNIVIRDCAFQGVLDQTVAVQSVGGGINNISIIDCTASGMHSLAQLRAVSGTALVQGCVLTNSSGGVNFYGPAHLIVSSCDFDVLEYAVRSGQTVGTIKNTGSVAINNSVLQTSSPTDGAVVLRGDSASNIIFTHSIITNTSPNGAALQNLNAASADQYAITLEETDVNGEIIGIDAVSITTIDDPNVPNGPVRVTPEPNTSILIILLAGVAVLLFLFIRCCCCPPGAPLGRDLSITSWK